MRDYTEYAERLAERYSALQQIGQPAGTWEDAYVPLYVQRGMVYADDEMQRHRKAIVEARKRVRQDRVKELLGLQPEYELLWRALAGASTPFADLASRESRLVLLSEAGAGKTTALRYLAAQQPVSYPYATDEGEIEQRRSAVVLVDLPAAVGRDLPEYLAEDAQAMMSLSVDPDFFEDLLSSGQAIVCVDGLDEIAGPGRRSEAIRQVESWVEQYPTCRYVVAARADAYEPALSRETFAHVRLAPWNEKVSEDIESAWNQALDEWQVDDPRRPFYAHRHRLWQHLALAMRLQGRRSVSREEAQEWLAEAVGADRGIRLSRRRAPAEIQLFLEESVPQLEMVDGDDSLLSFTPRLVQDILAARALEVLCVDRGAKALWEATQEHLGAADWRQTLVLVSGYLAEDDPKLWNQWAVQLLEAGEVDPQEPLLRRNLLLAASALGDPSNELDRGTRKRIIDGLVAWMVDPQAVGRLDAVEALSKLGDEPYAVEQVLSRAKDAELGTWSREAVALLLGTFAAARPDEAIEMLWASVDTEEEETERLRLAAVASLGALGRNDALDSESKEAIQEGLLQRAGNPELSIDLRAAAIEALGLILAETRSETILTTLIGLAKNENEGEDKVPYSVQIGSAEGLSSLLSVSEDPALLEQLWQIARDEEVDDAVRAELAETLGTVDDAAEAASVLIGLARSSKVYPPGQRNALEALGRVGSAPQSVVDQVIEIARTSDRSVKDFVRLTAAKTLGQLGYTTLAAQYLLQLVADKSIYRSTRNEALTAMGEMGSSGNERLDDAVVSVLLIWATEDNTTEDVRETAMDALIALHVNREDVIKGLIGAVQDKGTYPRVRRSTAAVFIQLPIEDQEQRDLIVDSLSTVFYDQDEKSDLLRVPIAQLLYLWAEDQHALEYLKAAAERSYMALVRYKASMILLELDEMEAAVAELLKLAQNPEIADFIRHDSLRALGLWTAGDEQVAEAIATIAQDSELESNVRGAAYASLRSITAS
jgi:hypothetical protein